MQLFEAILYVVDAGPDRSISIQFWARNRSQAEARVLRELGLGAVLALEEHKRWARPQALSPNSAESAQHTNGSDLCPTHQNVSNSSHAWRRKG